MRSSSLIKIRDISCILDWRRLFQNHKLSSNEILGKEIWLFSMYQCFGSSPGPSILHYNLGQLLYLSAAQPSILKSVQIQRNSRPDFCQRKRGRELIIPAIVRSTRTINYSIKILSIKKGGFSIVGLAAKVYLNKVQKDRRHYVLNFLKLNFLVFSVIFK